MRLNSEDKIAGIPSRLRAERKRLGYTLADVAKVTGISPSHISRIERGVNSLTLSSLVRIVGALDMEPAKLFEEMGYDFAPDPPAYPEDLSTYIFNLRKTRGMTLEEVASITDVCAATHWYLERRIADKTLVSTILDLDNAFVANGELIAQAWQFVVRQLSSLKNETPNGGVSDER